jgi:hypothetical protein
MLSVCVWFNDQTVSGNGKTKRKKRNKILDNIKMITTFAVPTNREPLNGC